MKEERGAASLKGKKERAESYSQRVGERGTPHENELSGKRKTKRERGKMGRKDLNCITLGSGPWPRRDEGWFSSAPKEGGGNRYRPY